MILCYDTVSPTFQGGVPANAQAILFYIDGLYANGGGARARFPHLFANGHAIGLTVLGRAAEGDDFEPGNWRGNAGAWVLDQLRRGVWRPIIYADGSDMASSVFPSLEAVFGRPLAPPGPGRRFRTILANPDGNPTIPSNHDGKQYWWGSIQGGGHVDMDVSSLRDDFFQHRSPTPHPITEDDMISAVSKPDGRVEVFVEKQGGEVWHAYTLKADQGGGWAGAEAGKRFAQWYSLGNPGHQK